MQFRLKMPRQTLITKAQVVSKGAGQSGEAPCLLRKCCLQHLPIISADLLAEGPVLVEALSLSRVFCLCLLQIGIDYSLGVADVSAASASQFLSESVEISPQTLSCGQLAFEDCQLRSELCDVHFTDSVSIGLRICGI